MLFGNRYLVLLDAFLDEVDAQFVEPGKIKRLLPTDIALDGRLKVIAARLAQVELAYVENCPCGNRIGYLFLADIAENLLHTALLDCCRCRRFYSIESVLSRGIAKVGSKGGS